MLYVFSKIDNRFEVFMWIQIPTPDIFRGKYRDIDYNNDEAKLSELYFNDVQQIVENAESRGRHIALFLIESFQSCGGQIIYPKGFLKQTFT